MKKSKKIAALVLSVLSFIQPTYQSGHAMVDEGNSSPVNQHDESEAAASSEKILMEIMQDLSDCISQMCQRDEVKVPHQDLKVNASVEKISMAITQKIRGLISQRVDRMLALDSQLSTARDILAADLAAGAEQRAWFLMDSTNFTLLAAEGHQRRLVIDAMSILLKSAGSELQFLNRDWSAGDARFIMDLSRLIYRLCHADCFNHRLDQDANEFFSAISSGVGAAQASADVEFTDDSRATLVPLLNFLVKIPLRFLHLYDNDNFIVNIHYIEMARVMLESLQQSGLADEFSINLQELQDEIVKTDKLVRNSLALPV